MRIGETSNHVDSLTMIPPTATAKPARVLFLADSGPEIGGGHLMRCLTLAGALRAQGSVCAFVARPDAAKILDAFAGPEVTQLPAIAGDVQSLAQQAEVLAADWDPEVVVVDHYGLVGYHETRLRAGGRRIVVLDDMVERRHDCDLLMDAAPDRTPEDYRRLLPPDAVVLTGPRHALLRPEFAAAREGALARRAEALPARRLLISLGLTDLLGITGRVVNLALPGLGELTVDVVVGAAAPSLTWLRRLQADDPRVRVHLETRAMAQLMTEADIAIGAGGSSTWERACLGLPAIDLILADNQRAVALELDRQGATLAVEARGEGFASRMTAALARLSTEAGLRTALSGASAALCDGEGARRVADAIMALVR